MRLTIITSNPGKVKEFEKALTQIGIEIDHDHIPYDEIQTSDLEDVVQNGLEFLGSKGMDNFIIDDSGMFIRNFDGFPGVYSAYVQKTLGNEGILKLMENVRDRRAEFKCCIGCLINGKEMIVTGSCPGTILYEEKGTEGFGYDPIFSPDGKRSFAEISIDEKNKISHRGLAIEALVKELRKSKLLHGPSDDHEY